MTCTKKTMRGRAKAAAVVGALTVAASLSVAPPASAGTVVHACPNQMIGVSGSTEGSGQITYVSGVGYGDCGTLGIRVNYTHVGGASWTGWKYSTGYHDYVSQNVGNSARQSQHTASVGRLSFLSYR